MRIPPVAMTHRTSYDDSEERRRQRLLTLLKELAATDPDVTRLNRQIASSGVVDKVLCEKIAMALESKTDRRSVRTRRLLLNLIEM